jgi:hypothetical protein
MKNLIRVPAVLMLLSAGGCTQIPPVPVATAQWYNPVDSYQEYVQRADKLTLSAGNAQEVNTRIQEVDPWPRNVGNTRIAVDGERMADAVYRYRCGKPAPEPLQVYGTTTSASAGGAGASGAGASSVRPGSDCGGAGAGGGGAKP